MTKKLKIHWIFDKNLKIREERTEGFPFKKIEKFNVNLIKLIDGF